jgi:CHAT domain-containing protein/tetratricopeptide (TPR) repeat protein
MTDLRIFRTGDRRHVVRGLRAVLLGCAIGASFPAWAGPLDDAAANAIEIQRLLDADDASAGEVLARMALADAERTLGNEAAEIGNLHRLLGDALYAQRRYAEAEPHFRAALAVRQELLGPQHLDVAVSTADLGYTLRALGRLEEAEPYYRQAMEIRRALGPNSPEAAHAALFYARLIDARADYGRAAKTFAEAVTLARTAFGPAHENIVKWRGEQAMAMHNAGQLSEAEAVYRDVIEELEQRFPADVLTLANMRQSLATLVRTSGRLQEAEILHRKAAAGREQAYGRDHPYVASALEGLGYALEQQNKPVEALQAYQRSMEIRDANGEASSPAFANMLLRGGSVLMQLGRAGDAEVMFRRMLAVQEQHEGPHGQGVANAVRWISRAALAQERNAEAETMMKRALAISESAHGATAVLTGFDLLTLGMHYAGQRRDVEAEPLLRRALSIMEAAGGDEGSVASARAALSLMYVMRGDHAEAAALFERSLAEAIVREGAASFDAANLMVTLAQTRVDMGQLDVAERLVADAERFFAISAPDATSRSTARGLMGDIRMEQGRHGEALEIYEALLADRQERFGEGSATTQMVLYDIGRARLALGNHAAATVALEQSTAIIERIAAIDAQAASSSRTGRIEDAAIARAGVFALLVRAYHEAVAEEPSSQAVEKAYLAAQRIIESQAANALAQMASRQAKGSGELAALVRERQDLVDRWRTLDEQLTPLLATAPGDRDAETADLLNASLASVDDRIGDIDVALNADFPDYVDLQRPAPLDVATTQAALDDDEVLLFYADMGPSATEPATTFLWALAKKGEPRWVKLERTPGEIGGAVSHLRSQLGVGPQTRGAASLTKPTGGDRTSEALTAAHEIYKVVLQPVADMIDGKSLVIVPSAKLSGLPFHLLVSTTAEEGDDRFRDASWVARDHAITILPSVASLPALANSDAASRPDRPYLGFANPLLSGRSGEDRRAFERAGCEIASPSPSDGPLQIASADLPNLDRLYRGAGADIDAVRRLEPLPETADEACAIAAILGAQRGAIRLGAKATESEVLRLSGSGELAQASVLHFATHALVAGELSGLAEPAIVLTPPDEAAPDDDGLLTASEVSTLRIAADWVILSACNTAAGDGGGEALSGLARAFFYAGARALMVSHWPVNSDAAVRLATRAIEEIDAEPGLGRAEALRRSMVAEIDRGGRHADPANWAPFILVGATR